LLTLLIDILYIAIEDRPAPNPRLAYRDIIISMGDEIVEKLKRKADLVCTLIFCERIPDETIAGERRLLRQWCQKFLPDRLELYDMVYEARFDRLIAQFRK
jgi:hypothetical protein